MNIALLLDISPRVLPTKPVPHQARREAIHPFGSASHSLQVFQGNMRSQPQTAWSTSNLRRCEYGIGPPTRSRCGFTLLTPRTAKFQIFFLCSCSAVGLGGGAQEPP
jgi:hypothetical protein